MEKKMKHIDGKTFIKKYLNDTDYLILEGEPNVLMTIENLCYTPGTEANADYISINVTGDEVATVFFIAKKNESLRRWLKNMDREKFYDRLVSVSFEPSGYSIKGVKSADRERFADFFVNGIEDLTDVDLSKKTVII